MFSKPFYYIFKTKDHSFNKDKILEAIGQFGPIPLRANNDPQTYISSSDWGGDSKWLNVLLSPRDHNRYLHFVVEKFNKKGTVVNFQRSWFNQYYSYSGANHHWHDHAQYPTHEDFFQVANVYYVELEDKSLRTRLKHPITGKEVVPKVNEGDILLFSSTVKHMSPRNYTSTRKTVVSFNTEFV